MQLHMHSFETLSCNEYKLSGGRPVERLLRSLVSLPARAHDRMLSRHSCADDSVAPAPVRREHGVQQRINYNLIIRLKCARFADSTARTPLPVLPVAMHTELAFVFVAQDAMV